ncbi:MAG: ADP-ribosylglycohydrolase family protein [Magnetospiraceae bacterium]
MIGAIIGDIVGAPYEGRLSNRKSKDFPFFSWRSKFTDDTVCTIAVADCLLEKGDFAPYLRRYYALHPKAGYGGMYAKWARTPDMGPYNSWGNGSAMRVSPVPYVAQDETELLDLAAASAAVTHNHPDGIAGAQALALAMWRACTGTSAPDIREEIADRFAYDLSRSVDEIRPKYKFDVSCAGSVPQAVTCALEAVDFEDAIRNAVSIGGDSDTIACMAGGLAECLFDIPPDMIKTARNFLTFDLLAVVDRFDREVIRPQSDRALD